MKTRELTASRFIRAAKPPTFSQTTMTCGRKVVIAVLVTLCLLGMVGKAIEEREALSAAWSTLLWVLALGGHFWGAIAVGCAALTVLAWAICVAVQLGEEAPMAALLWPGALAIVLWLLATIALQTTFEDFDALTVYRKIAAIGMNMPYLAPFIALLGVGLRDLARAIRWSSY